MMLGFVERHGEYFTYERREGKCQMIAIYPTNLMIGLLPRSWNPSSGVVQRYCNDQQALLLHNQSREQESINPDRPEIP